MCPSSPILLIGEVLMSEEPIQDRNERTLRARRRELIKRAVEQRARFQDLVMKVIDNLPPAFRERLENVDIVVTDWPTPVQLSRNKVKSRYSLLGLYEGVPHTRRGPGYGFVLPDKISIFRKPIEAKCRSWQEVGEEVKKVVQHEIAHHFGIGEQKLQSLENNR